MIAYVDSSILLRVVLGQPDRLVQWEGIASGVTSTLTEVECLRTLDRRQQRRLLLEDEYAERRALALRFLGRMNRVEIGRTILARAADPFCGPLGTLDAIHLSTAIAWRRAYQDGIVMTTHDRELGLAARAEGFEVLGLQG